MTAPMLDPTFKQRIVDEGPPVLVVRRPSIGARRPLQISESSLYGLAELELYSTLSGAHWWCAVNEFCRNPLHPGPCKGWKHMLHSIAPGAYHAYEQQRVQKLNERRKAKIAELEAAGKKIPSYLKKEVTYLQQPKAPEGVQFHVPTPKEAVSKLPATAKEIGAKIAMKHADIAQAKTEHLKANQKAAVLALMQAHQGQLTPGAEKSASAFVDQAQAKLKPGEKLSDVPQIHNTLDIIAQKQGDAAGLDAQQKAELLADLKQHVDEGIPELPLLLTSAKNAAKAKQDAEQAKKDAEELAAKKAAQGDALHQVAVAVGSSGEDVGSKKAFHNAIENAHAKLPEGGKVSEAPGMHALLNHLAQKGNGQLTELHDKLGKTGPGISKVSQEVADHVDQGKPGLPPSLAKIAELQKQVEAKQAHGTGRHVGKLTPTGQTLGTHGAKLTKDETGKEFLVKPGDFTGKAEIAASKLAAAVGVSTPQVHNVPGGTAQEFAKNAKDAFPGKAFDPAKLSDKDILDLQKHHVLDWLIGNHDAHPGNFLRDEHGNLVEIDKGQAFKHYHEDQLSPQYHPNAAYGETEPVYNTLVKAAKQGQVELNDPNKGELGDFIGKVQALPDDKLKAMFRPYADAAAKEGKLPGAPSGGKSALGGANPAAVDSFLNKIVDRKTKLKKSFSALHHNNLPAKSGVSAPAYTPAQVKAATAPAYHSGNPYTHPHLTSPLTKAEFDGLDAPHQEKVIGSLDSIIKKHPATEASGQAKGLKHTYLPNTPQPAATGADELAGQAKTAPPPGGSLAPHVQEAVDLATGSKHGTAKTKVTAYDKLTADEYHSLPHAAQDQIHIDLVTAHSKFLDPKKQQQVKSILDKIGLPQASPHGAGAPHEKPAGESQYDKIGAAHAAVQQLATGQPAKTSPAGYAKWYQENHSMADLQAMTAALASKWGQNHVSGLPISGQHADEIKAKAKAEIQNMLHKGLTEPPPGGVLYTAEHMNTSVSAAGKASLLKHAAGIEWETKPGEGAGGGLKDEALKILSVPGGGLMTKASQLSKEHFDALPESSQNVLIDQLKDLEADAGPEMSAKATGLIEKFTGKAAPAAPEKKVASKAGLGKGKLITKIPPSVKGQMLDAYKSHGQASYLKATPEENYQAVLNVAHAFHNKPGAGTLSLSQVIDSIDQQQAQKLGVSNTGMLKQKITDWLATPEGKKAALSLKPDAGKVGTLGGDFVEPVKPSALKVPKGAKVPKVAGPGPYKAAQTGFTEHKHGKMLALQTSYQKSTGQQWTPEQTKAIKAYTSSSTYINGWLRNGEHGYGETPQQAIHLQSAMLPIQENTSLSRGTDWVQLPEGFRTPELAKKLVGKTISDPGFVSTAIKGESHGFTSNPVMMHIEAPKGTMGAYLEHVTSVSGEYEMLLAAGTKFKIISVTEGSFGGSKRTVVKCRVVS